MRIEKQVQSNYIIFFYFTLWPTNAHFTNYQTPTCFDTIVSSTACQVRLSISNAAVGNTIYN